MRQIPLSCNVEEIKSMCKSIQNNHLKHIESDIDTIKSKIEENSKDMKELKIIVSELHKNMMRNETLLDLFINRK